MFPRIQGLFHSVTEKRHNNECGENSVTIVTEKKIEDDSSDSSSGENVEIEETEEENGKKHKETKQKTIN
ncbi:uncharacterized protein isoform X2 [Choristoneura fumiferana]|uniref:uncharacterized protein isoform X2 n=1 Tax=Choristoneura fumiferana TaxID=7141 RepID=UPI003D15B68D